MAIGKASDFVIYHEEFYAGLVERITQMVDAFGAASRNSIRVVVERSRGDYRKAAFFKDISTLITRRDVTSTDAVTDLAMTAGEHISVKVHRKIGPVAQTLDAWRRIGSDQREMSFRLGEVIAEKKAQDYLNTSIKALVGALGVSAFSYFTSTASVMNTGKLVSGLAKFGDAQNDIVCWVMHSKSWFDLVAEQLTNAAGYGDNPEIGGFVVRSGTPITLGRPVIVTDSAALITTGIPDTYHVLGLATDSCVLEESEQPELVTDMITGLENLVYRVQGEYTFNMGLRGLKWDTANGGASPTDTALGTGSNWDAANGASASLAEVKRYPGVRVNTQ